MPRTTLPSSSSDLSLSLESKRSVLVKAPEDDMNAPRHEYVVVLGGSNGTPYQINMGTAADGTGMHIFIKGLGDNVSLPCPPLPSLSLTRSLSLSGLL
jgi:hypothetical protein